MSETLTRESAREYFKECGLTYESINHGSVEKMVLLLHELISEFNKGRAIKRYYLKKPANYQKVHWNKWDFISGKFYVLIFDRKNNIPRAIKEAFNFREDGFIEIAEWADENTVQYFLEAFVKWCDYVKMYGAR